MHMYANDHPTRRRRQRRVALLAAGLALTAGLAACGDSADDEDAAAPTSSTQASPSTSAAGAGDVGAFCDAVIEVDATFAAGGPAGPDPARLQSAFQEAQATAPADIAEQVGEVIRLSQEAVASEDEEGGPPPEVEELDAQIDEYVLANCSFSEVAVSGVEYEFEGLPESLPAGEVAFDFANEGGEQHELVVFRINDDVTASIQELIELPEEEAFQMVEVKGFAFAEPGGTDQSFVDLEPGRYGAVCFVPLGSTPEAVAGAEESGQQIEGPPHFTQGMIAEFTVE